MKDTTFDGQTPRTEEEIERLGNELEQLSRDLKHERELRQEQINSLRRELADSQEKTELRLRLEISEKLRQLPPRE